MNKYHIKVMTRTDKASYWESVIVEANTLLTTQGAYMFHSEYDRQDSDANILVASYPVNFTIIEKVER